MPPQQRGGLLDLLDDGDDFGAHESVLLRGYVMGWGAGRNALTGLPDRLDCQTMTIVLMLPCGREPNDQ
jgi:hypothetical protein